MKGWMWMIAAIAIGAAACGGNSNSGAETALRRQFEVVETYQEETITGADSYRAGKCP